MAEMISNGVTFAIHDGTSTYNAVGGVVSISGFGAGSATVVDVTDLGDTYKQKISGQLDGGQVSVSFNADTADTYQTQIKTDFVAGTVRNFQITLTDSGTSTVTFAAVISSQSYGAAIDDKVTLDVTLDVSGGYTWA